MIVKEGALQPQSIELLPVADVSMKEDVGYDAVEGLLNRRIDHQMNWKKINAIGLLGIDEISLR